MISNNRPNEKWWELRVKTQPNFLLWSTLEQDIVSDWDTNSFVIIEFKRDKNVSVIDQGYAYLALLLNNKADFILLYNETGEKKTLNEVDWSQSRVIFISPSFTTYQRKAIEFRDLPIELWEVEIYSNNTILFNQIQSPEKSESVNKISQRSEVVKTVNKHPAYLVIVISYDLFQSYLM